ncbi:hypothetical protein HYH02_009776 [Chlamydomonas schloesseri]|uniref:Carbohydrate kinase PfkB domain-containing protein n=1 Tax=Chlamydomonas schloesseri TaxID=2026947 RepID=A0A835TB87_9CHLO|nr:hypothetical protein HYH02_009776 [Chlamydomonas schloesseri]|eukprot:KAG2441983.1 hypothetical protein HYH02_009776 [Chlamydomonas schloesseri]
MDILARVSPEWLATVAPEAGGCLPVAPEEMEKLLAAAATQSELTRIPGGSAANVVKGVAQIAGGGAACRFVGMVGADATGAEYRAKLAATGVAPVLLESGSGAPSACAVCFVTPDGQRTMRTCLGASLELRSCAQLPAGWSQGCGLLHAEGYCLYRPQLAREMMSLARAAGALTSIDLASFELVRNCKESLLGLLQDGLIDLIFANEEEAVTLCSELGLLPPPAAASTSDGAASAPSTAAEGNTDAAVEAAQRYLLSPTGGRCKLAVTSLGARGCVARAADGGHGAAAACRVPVVDTIGAGDFFTAGFLAAYLRGGSLTQCAAAGCASGAEAVQAKGAELPAEAFERLRAAIDGILTAQPAAGGAVAAAGAAAAVAAAMGAATAAKAVGTAAAGGTPVAAATAKPEPVPAMV